MRESKWEIIIIIIIECQIVERSERKMGDMKHKTNWWENWRFCYNSASWYTNNSQVHEFRQNRGLRSMYHVCPRVYAL
jgi:hypothetical protein